MDGELQGRSLSTLCFGGEKPEIGSLRSWFCASALVRWREMINPVGVIDVPAKGGMSSRQVTRSNLPIDNWDSLAGLPGYSGALLHSEWSESWCQYDRPRGD